KYKAFSFGFLIGLFWFYWISFSFIYYDLPYLIPFIILFVAFVYGLIFFIGFFVENFFLKALFLSIVGYINPFGFNWFQMEILLLDSFFEVQKWQFILLIFAIAMSKENKIFYPNFKYSVSAVLMALSIIKFDNSTPNENNLNILITSTSIPQEIKWDREKLIDIVLENFKMIDNAIKDGYDAIIFPENAFPTYLNIEEKMVELLLERSKKITIVTGALRFEDDKFYNSNYIFEDGNFTIANKVELVPFGEKIPLPKFMARYLNDIFFNGAEDFEQAKEVVDIKIKGVTFRNAICYEATVDRLYENSPKFMIAISNNAWFKHSIEPTMQYMLLRLYSKKYNTTIYHSANMEKSALIK
ncbi:MAG: apolipoprotein N-acyltransferase, partial [Campylobacterales bacterium]|nr:apolipoprotein N-acyltransferase [Campylobacterales bacterium]